MNLGCFIITIITLLDNFCVIESSMELLVSGLRKEQYRPTLLYCARICIMKCFQNFLRFMVVENNIFVLDYKL